MYINIRKHKILDHPILSLFLLVLIGEIFIQFSGIPFGIIARNLDIDTTTIEIVYILISIALALVSLWIFKLWFQGQYKGSITSKRIVLGLIYMIFPLFIFCGTNLISLEEIGSPIIAIIYGIAPGIGEEIIYRAIPLSNAMRNVKKNYQIILYVFINGLLFGAIHFLNIFMGAGFGLTISQVIYASGMGMLFGAIFIRTGNIVPCMIAHSLIDISGLLDSTLQQTTGILPDIEVGISVYIVSFILFLIPFMISLIVLNPMKLEEVKNIWKEKWNQ